MNTSDKIVISFALNHLNFLHNELKNNHCDEEAASTYQCDFVLSHFVKDKKP